MWVIEEYLPLQSCVTQVCVSLRSAGYWYIANYLLDYFPGMDMERRNCHGFTALMKAAMQGRAECVRVLMLSGRAHTMIYYLSQWKATPFIAQLYSQILPCTEQLYISLCFQEAIFRLGTMAAS